MQLQCQDTWDDQTNQVQRIAQLIHNVVSVDEVILRFFIEEYVPDPKHVFLKIVKEKIPHRKQVQQSLITMLTYCFYRIRNEKQYPAGELEMIERCYQQYIKFTAFLPSLVKYYQLVIQWADRLLKLNDFVAARKQLLVIIQEMEIVNTTQLEILTWRSKLCLLMLETMLSKSPIQRKQVLKIIKTYKLLKKDKKIAINSTVYAFVFLVEQLIASKSDLYIYFEMELKHIKKEPLQDTVFHTIQQALKRCEEFATKKIVSAVQVYIRQKIPIRKYPEKHDQRFKKIWHNQQINQDILRKVDHFMRFRPAVGTLSANRTPRLSISLDQQQANTFGSMHETTRLGWFKSSGKIRREESAISLSRTGGISRRKRREIYRNINKDKQSESKVIKAKNLQDEMYEIESILQERCKITFNQILFGEVQQTQKKEEPDAVKIVGATEDKDFGSITLTFFVIFNQEMAELRVILTKHSRNFLVECFIQSTYCRHASKLFIQSSKQDSQEVTLDDLSNFVEGSIIYYQALQERVERKISIKELQVVQEMMRTKLNKELSHSQLTKTLQTVELVKTQFFWYYTKSSYINGSKLEKRKINIELEDQSAFAVCLGKFKSDYDCCLNQLIEVQNIRSLIQTCVYLSHGRLVVYRQLRLIKGKIYLEVITISHEVYKSFNRKGKIPYFQTTVLERMFIDLSKGKTKKLGSSKIDVRAFLSEENVFNFFMKNIVQNLIERKYLRKIQQFLAVKNQQESIDWFDDRNIPDIPKYKLECVNNNEILQSVEMKSHLNETVANFREIIVSYASIYQLKPLFRMESRKEHHFKIAGRAYFAEQYLFKNRLKVVKLFKAGSRSTYHLFMYHQNPLPLAVIRTAFHSRVALISQEGNEGVYIVNLMRNSCAQEYLINDTPNPIKQVIRWGDNYIYACISETQSLLCWRLDLYFPDTQTHYFTLLDQQLYFECLLKWNRIDQEVWRKALRYLEFDQQRKSVTINSRSLKLFQVLKKMVLKQENKLFAITLVKRENRLSYMIVDYEAESLSIGKIDDIPIYFSGSLHGYGASSHKTLPTVYSSLITRLYYQAISGIVPSEKISSDYFIYQ